MKDWVRVQLFVHLLISNRMKWNSNVVQSHPPSVHTPWGPALNVRLRETQRKWLKSGRGTSLPSCASGITPSMRFSVSSPDETPRRELKIRPQEYHSHRYTTFTEIPHDQGYDTHVTVSQFTVTRSQIKNHWKMPDCYFEKSGKKSRQTGKT